MRNRFGAQANEETSTHTIKHASGRETIYPCIEKIEEEKIDKIMRSELIGNLRIFNSPLYITHSITGGIFNSQKMIAQRSAESELVSSFAKNDMNDDE
jgi:hypothetical protein